MMKKNTAVILTAIIAAALTLLTACSGVSSMNPEKLKIDRAYKFTANICFGDSNVKAGFERRNANLWEVTLMEPYPLEGVVLVYENGMSSAKFEGFEATVADEGDGIAKRVIDAFENAINGEGREVMAAGEEITITSKAGNPACSYTLVLNKADLEPLTLKIPEMSLAVEFAEVQISQIVQVILPGDEYDGEQAAFNERGVTPIR